MIKPHESVDSELSSDAQSFDVSSSLEWRLCTAGLLLFLLGIGIGFVIHASPNPPAMRVAHLDGVQSAPFLVVLGLLWPRLKLGLFASKVLSHLTWISFWGLELGLFLTGFRSARTPPAVMRAVGLLGDLSGVVMLLSMAVIVFVFIRRSIKAPQRGRIKPSTG